MKRYYIHRILLEQLLEQMFQIQPELEINVGRRLKEGWFDVLVSGTETAFEIFNSQISRIMAEIDDSIGLNTNLIEEQYDTIHNNYYFGTPDDVSSI